VLYGYTGMHEPYRLLENLFCAAALPDTVGALEAALGIRLAASVLQGGTMGTFTVADLGPPIASLSVKYAWDMYHQHPVASLDELRARGLLHFAVRVPSGRSRLDAALRACFGEPRELPSCHVFGSVVLQAIGDGDACEVSRYGELPAWAMAPPDPAIPHPRARRALNPRPAVPLGSKTRVGSINCTCPGIARRQSARSHWA
jgi:hypothetical protein